MSNGDSTAIYVETAARLHLGVLDPRGSLGRWFGGIGASAPQPRLLVSVSTAKRLEVEGADAERALEFASRFLTHHQLRCGARVRIHRAIPSHAGLGSGTQLGLAIARGLAELNGIECDAPALARAVGRGRRSAVGTWTFAGGGLVLEGGRRRDNTQCGPLLARLPLPATWHCVVAVPDQRVGLAGPAEEAAFKQLPLPSAHDVERVAHIVLMMLLPAVADADLANFGRALTEVQQITGRWFAPLQGGVFARGPSEELVRRMRRWGAHGVGQSSWGPTVYGMVEGANAASQLADSVRGFLGERGAVYEGCFRDFGARMWRASVTEIGGPDRANSVADERVNEVAKSDVDE